MAFFGSLKNSLKQKWLQYFQTNRFWISLHSGAVATPDGGKRPASYLILGIINALEPQLAELMLPFLKLNPNVDALIEILGLNFDPDLMLGNNSATEVKADTQLLQVDELLAENPVTDRARESVVIIDKTEMGEGLSVSHTTGAEAFTVTSLDEITFDESEDLDPNNIATSSEDDFSNVFLAVGDRDNLELELTSNSDFTEDDSHPQDNQDISGLFPNF